MILGTVGVLYNLSCCIDWVQAVTGPALAFVPASQLIAEISQNFTTDLSIEPVRLLATLADYDVTGTLGVPQQSRLTHELAPGHGVAAGGGTGGAPGGVIAGGQFRAN